MTEAEYCTRKAFENATEDYVRGAVWAIMKVYELIPHNAIEHEHETIQQIIDLEKTFPDYISAEKDSFEFNRGATWGFNRFALMIAKDEEESEYIRLTTIGGYGSDIIEQDEQLLSFYETLPMDKENAETCQVLRERLEWAKDIERNKSW